MTTDNTSIAESLASTEVKPSSIAPPPTVSADLWSEPEKSTEQEPKELTRGEMIEILFPETAARIRRDMQEISAQWGDRPIAPPPKIYADLWGEGEE